MKRILTILFTLMVSLSLMAQTNNNLIFIGDFSLEHKVSILSEFNSGKYNDFFELSRQIPTQNLCDDTLLDLNDTISGCDWSTIPWNDSSACVALPDFPNCTLYIPYRVRICPNNPSIRQLYILGFIMTYCEDFQNYLSSGDEFERATKLNYVFQNLYLLISQHEAEQMASIPSCDSLGTNLPQYIFYTEEACKGKLELNIVLDPINHPEPEIMILDNISCSRDAVCCKTSISFCQNNFGELISQINKERIGANCVGDRPVELDYEYLLQVFYQIDPNLSFNPLPCTKSCE